MGDELELAVGDAVVYAGHGVGVVVAREPEHVVIECDRSLSVTFSLEHARVVLRPLATEADIRDVQAALRAEDSTLPEHWQKRVKEIRAKVTGGKVVELAEVVRDSDLRRRQVAGRGGGGSLSTNERQLSLRARQMLAEELGLVRGVEPDEADSWIGAQLAEGSADDRLSPAAI